MKFFNLLYSIAIYSGAALGIGFICYGVVYGIWESQELNNFGKYTIGITQKKAPTAKSGIFVDYTYVVNGKTYKGSSSEIGNVKVPGGRYFTKFSHRYPKANRIDFDQEVPDSIVECPPDGWNEIPGK